MATWFSAHFWSQSDGGESGFCRYVGKLMFYDMQMLAKVVTLFE
jgi:hypothetical protein